MYTIQMLKAKREWLRNVEILSFLLILYWLVLITIKSLYVVKEVSTVTLTEVWDLTSFIPQK